MTEFTVKEVTVFRVVTFLSSGKYNFLGIYKIFKITNKSELSNVISIRNNKIRLFKFGHR